MRVVSFDAAANQCACFAGVGCRRAASAEVISDCSWLARLRIRRTATGRVVPAKHWQAGLPGYAIGARSRSEWLLTRVCFQAPSV